MIAHVCKAGRETGRLTAYLMGKGRSNEHTDQRIVASTGAQVLDGDPAVWFPGDEAMVYAGEVWTHAGSHRLGRALESDWAEQRDPVLVGHAGASVRVGSAAGPAAGVVDRPGERLVDEPWQRSPRAGGGRAHVLGCW